MLKVAIKRVAALVPMLLLVSLSVFLLVEFLPGDPAVIVAGGENATPEEIQAARERLGLDKPLPVRYGEWVGDAVRGDLGESLTSATSVTAAIRKRLPVTFSIALVALIFAVVLGVTAGVVAALRENSLIDRLVTSGASLSMSLPPFIAGLLLVRIFAFELEWLPATGYKSIGEAGVWGWLERLILPGFALALVYIGYFARQTRAALVDVNNQDFIRTARAKGLKRRRIVGLHVAKAAAAPVITVIGLTAGRLLGGSVVVEAIFGISGFGSLVVQAVNSGDIPMLQGAVIVAALVVLVMNLIVDLSYPLLNPKLRD